MQRLLREKAAAGQNGHVDQWKGGVITLDRVQTKAPANPLHPSSALSELSSLLFCFQPPVTHWCPKSLHGCWARCWEACRNLLGFPTCLVFPRWHTLTDFMDLQLKGWLAVQWYVWNRLCKYQQWSQINQTCWSVFFYLSFYNSECILLIKAFCLFYFFLLCMVCQNTGTYAWKVVIDIYFHANITIAQKYTFYKCLMCIHFWESSNVLTILHSWIPYISCEINK